MDSPNHYELLCVTPEATADEIRSAYRRLIRVYHPDVATEAGSAMTQRLNEAQRELLDPTLRANYDTTLRRFSAQATSSYSGARQSGYSQPRYSAGSYGSRGSAGSAGASSTRPESSAPWPGAPRMKAITFSPRRYYASMAGLILSSATILIATFVVFAICYSGELTLFSPRFVPPVFVGIAWLVGAMRKPPKVLIALMVIGAGLWPLSAAGIEPFSVVFGASWTPVLVSLTLIATAVVVFRTVAPLAAAQSTARPARRKPSFVS